VKAFIFLHALSCRIIVCRRFCYLIKFPAPILDTYWISRTIFFFRTTATTLNYVQIFARIYFCKLKFFFANLVFIQIFVKQTRYGIKQKSIGPKMNENFMRKRNIAKIYFRELRFSKYFVRI